MRPSSRGSPPFGFGTIIWSIKDCANEILCPAVACRQRARAPMMHHPEYQRHLVRRLSRMPTIPSDNDWVRVVAEVAREGLRNRLMFALAYYGALRREELVGLRVSDFDVARRLVTVRPETSKSSRSQDRLLRCGCSGSSAGRVSSSASRRGLASGSDVPFGIGPRCASQPISRWSWSKVVERIARQAGVPEFSTHTLRHLFFIEHVAIGLAATTRLPRTPGIATCKPRCNISTFPAATYSPRWRAPSSMATPSSASFCLQTS